MSLSPLEKRTAGLELALDQTVSFGETLLSALKSILERMQALEAAVAEGTVFNASVPGILADLSGRVISLEEILKAEGLSSEAADTTLKSFADRMNALSEALPALLAKDSSVPVLGAGQPVKDLAPLQSPEAESPLALTSALKDVTARLNILEAELARSASRDQPLGPSGGARAPIVTPSATDSSAEGFLEGAGANALKETLRNVVERMSAIEAMSARLSATTAATVLPLPAVVPGEIEPIKQQLQNVESRLAALEAKAMARSQNQAETLVGTGAGVQAQSQSEPPVAAHQRPDIVVDLSSSVDALQKLTSRVAALEASLGSDSQRLDARQPDQAAWLGQASQLYHKTKTVVFVGSDIFGDNVKYAYLSFCSFAAGTDMTATFLCRSLQQYEQLRSEHLPCISPNPADWTAEEAKTLISAKLVVLDHEFMPAPLQDPTPFALLKGAKTIQLWHGTPIKEIGLQNLFSTREGSKFRAEILAHCGPFDVLVGAASSVRHDWDRWLSFKEFSPVGNPRTDIFFQNLSAHDRINVDKKTLDIVQAARGEGRRVVLYAPTFRDHNPGWFDGIGLEGFAAHCLDRGWLLFVNLHPREQGAVAELQKAYPSINFVQPGTDIFPVAKYTDCLVTDYSSLAFDFLYCDRPVVFYRPDHADYVARACALAPKHEALTAGPVTGTVEALIGAVANVFDRPDMDTFRETRAIMRKKTF
ncbi:MAG: CDP-glycerol glycerophosphotransferase family protein [Pseudomonadota bacterium]|nr:CDP-glycerol glycerophosphotransferase family protein [Pseudomonadota bacterium]